MRKKIIGYILVLSVFLSNFSFFSYALSASSAIVMLCETNETLYELNSKVKMSMASTTKIMTALLAVESGRLDEVVTVTDKMVRVEGTSMGLRAGDRLTLMNIVKGMMLLSGNDAANAVAYYLSGGLENFADKMNKKAREIGMTDTNFVTASGLDDDGHYSTAYDMALLASYAMKNSLFRGIVKNYSASVDYIYPDVSYTYRNHNRFLTMYDGACGIKTGFTKKSGRCLVTAVERDGYTVVAVTLKAPDDWNDHIYLYDKCLPKIKVKAYGDRFNTVLNVVGGEKSKIIACTQEIIKIPYVNVELKTEIYSEKLYYAPIKKGEILGCVRVYCEGELFGEYALAASQSIEIKEIPLSEKGLKYKINELFRRFERWLITQR